MEVSRRNFLKTGSVLGLGFGLSYLLDGYLPDLARTSPNFVLTSILDGNFERFSKDHGSLLYRDLTLHTLDLQKLFPLDQQFPVNYQPNKSKLYNLAYAAGFTSLAYLIPFYLSSPEKFRSMPLWFRLAAASLIGFGTSNLLGNYISMAIEDQLEARLGPGVAAIGLKNPDGAIIYRLGIGTLVLARDYHLSDPAEQYSVQISSSGELAYKRIRFDVLLDVQDEGRPIQSSLYLFVVPEPTRYKASIFSAAACTREPNQLILSAQPPEMAEYAGMSRVCVFGHHKNPFAGLVPPDVIDGSSQSMMASVYQLYEIIANNLAMHTAPNLILLRTETGQPVLAGPLSWASTGAISYGQRLTSIPTLSPTLFMAFVSKTGLYDVVQAHLWAQATRQNESGIQRDILEYESVWRDYFTKPTTEENRTPHPANQRLLKLDSEGRVEIVPAQEGVEQFLKTVRQQPKSLLHPEANLVRPGAIIYPGETPPEDRLDLDILQKSAINMALVVPDSGTSLNPQSAVVGRLLGFLTLYQSIRMPMALLTKLVDEALEKGRVDPQNVVKVYLDEHTAGGIEAAG
jgi:hypothetical protein